MVRERGVGFIAGKTLESVKDQWGKLIEVDVDVILFDKALYMKEISSGEFDLLSDDKKGLFKYVQTMAGAQDMTGNTDRYYVPSDLVSGDVLVLISLDVLFDADVEVWPEIMRLKDKGVGLVILEYGFDSRGEYGDMMIKKMNKMFELGQYVQQRSGTFSEPAEYQIK